MGIKDVIIIASIVIIIGLAVLYIYKAKKSGQKCIGCPNSSSCSAAAKKNCNGGCSDCNKNKSQSEK